MIKKIIGLCYLGMVLIFVNSCKDDVLPKPVSQLRLDYPVATYAHFSNDCPFEFDMNEDAIITQDKNCDFSIKYPKMKATIYLNYKTVDNNLNDLLKDAQTLTYKHVIKADDILEIYQQLTNLGVSQT